MKIIFIALLLLCLVIWLSYLANLSDRAVVLSDPYLSVSLRRCLGDAAEPRCRIESDACDDGQSPCVLLFQ